MKWDERKLSDTVDCVKRRIPKNEFAESFWMRYWELNYAKRWRTETAQVLAKHHCGVREGKPRTIYYPIEPVEPVKVLILTGRE